MGLLLVLLLAGTMVIQGQNNVQPGFRNRSFYGIPDLTEKQKTDLAALSEKHRTTMDTLRAEMLRTTDIQKRGDIARDLQIEKDTHRNDVLNLLTEKQKEALTAWQPGPRGRGPAYGNNAMRGRGRDMDRGNMNCNCCPVNRGWGRGYRNIN